MANMCCFDLPPSLVHLFPGGVRPVPDDPTKGNYFHPEA